MLTDVLPLALAIAASPFPIIPVILLLFTPRALTNASSFLSGWVTGIAAAVTAFVLLADVFEAGTETPTWAAWARIALGTALVVLGVRQWVQRHASDELPGWMQTIETATPRSALRLGLLLSAANPKILLLAAAAGLAIGSEASTPVSTVGAVAAFTVVASSTVAIPVTSYAILHERILAPLRTTKDWLQTHNAAVMAVVVTVVGVALVVKGINGL